MQIFWNKNDFAKLSIRLTLNRVISNYGGLENATIQRNFSQLLRVNLARKLSIFYILYPEKFCEPLRISFNRRVALSRKWDGYKIRESKWVAVKQQKCF